MKTIRNMLILAFVLADISAFAQDADKKAKIEDFHERKWQYLMDVVHLVPSDAQRVKPIFMNYENQLWELHSNNRKQFRPEQKDKKNCKPNFAEMNDKYVEFEFKQAQLLKGYHEQLKKILDPETLFRYYQAEREFKRKLLKDFKGPRPPEQPRPQ